MSYSGGIWLAIDKDSEEKAELLVRKLDNLNLKTKMTLFDKMINGETSRQPSEIKNLEEFLLRPRKDSIIRLNVGRTEQIGKKDIALIHFIWNINPCKDDDQFYWFKCEFDEGYKPIDKIFREIYSKSLMGYKRA